LTGGQVASCGWLAGGRAGLLCLVAMAMARRRQAGRQAGRLTLRQGERY